MKKKKNPCNKRAIFMKAYILHFSSCVYYCCIFSCPGFTRQLLIPGVPWAQAKQDIFDNSHKNMKTP